MKKVKRQGNLVAFAFFGLFCEAAMLSLLGQASLVENVLGFVFAANAFLLYRVVIEEKRATGYLQKEMRRWWLRREPENSIAFAFVGGMVLVVCNFGLLATNRPLDLWANGFVAVALVQMGFEAGRQLFNGFSAYLLTKFKEWRLNRKVTKIGGEEKAWIT